MGIVITPKQGEIAETVLLPGDPLRAKFVADTFLTDAVCYNEERNMLGYTGTYRGRRVSVQGTGMGVPSVTMCAHELICEYGAKRLIRIGTCGAIRPDVELRSVVIALSASTSANAEHILGLHGVHFAPTADFGLVRSAAQAAEKLGIPYRVGSVLTAELFHNDPDFTKKWAEWGHLAIEMEAAGLYMEAARDGAKALTVLTVSDSLVTGELTTPEERQTSFTDMMKVALETAVAGE